MNNVTPFPTRPSGLRAAPLTRVPTADEFQEIIESFYRERAARRNLAYRTSLARRYGWTDIPA